MIKELRRFEFKGNKYAVYSTDTGRRIIWEITGTDELIWRLKHAK